MIYSVSPFKNELDVLEIRLGTIGHMIDRFVLAEATVDQRGRPKELVFQKHWRRFVPWLHKIEYVVVDDMPVGTTHQDDHIRERFQRDALARGMPNLRPDDVVLVSDLDEIPSPEALQDAIDNPPLRLLMDLFVYRLNWRWLDRGCRIGTLCATVDPLAIRAHGVSWAVIHDQTVQIRPGISGWHLTYQGDVDTLRAKMTGMMDNFIEQLVPEEKRGAGESPFLTDEWIQESIDTGRDIYDRDYRPSEWVGLDQLPPYVQENAGRFQHMLVPEPAVRPTGPRCSCGAIFAPSGELAHFTRCDLADVPGTLVYIAEGVFERTYESTSDGSPGLHRAASAAGTP